MSSEHRDEQPSDALVVRMGAAVSSVLCGAVMGAQSVCV